MTFEDMFAQSLAMLQRHGRLTYRALQHQFQLNDTCLETLKDQLLYMHAQVTDDPGRGLIWTGNRPAPEADLQRSAEAGRRFHAVLPVLTALLQRESRITYQMLKDIFAFDDILLDELRRELIFKRQAMDERGEGLVWTDGRPTARSDLAGVALEPARQAAEAERRHLTVMFCDLVGSTDLSGQLDPEDLREVVRAYQATAAEVIDHYQGHIAQYLGDGLLIYFGYPVAHEDDARRAVYTGLGIPEAIKTLNTRLQTDYHVQLAVRIGIHTGPVVVGEMGGGGRYESLAMGETPNIAARLEGLARPNTVVISAVTARLVRNSFVMEDLGTHALKGVAAPLALSRVLGPLEIDHERASFANLVGRDEEIGLLRRRWEQSKEGLGQVVLISGEAGIGKSSLVEGLRDHVRRERATRVVFRCSPYATNSALYPIIDGVQRLLDWQPDDSAATKLKKLKHGLQSISLAHEEAVPLLAALLAVPLPEGDYPALGLTAQQQRQQTQNVLVAWLLEQAEHQPMLAVWEDLHWADPSTLETLVLFIEQAPTASMLHVLTFRPEFESPWSARSHITPMSLNRLEGPQVEALITHLARGKRLPEEVVRHIVAKTDGVPLYVEELTKMLLESDLLAEDAERYELTGPLSGVTIPDTLQDSLMARLDQLNTAKEVVQLGAVLGREFSYDLIQAVSPQDEETLQIGLAQLVEAELLYQRGRPPKARYLFKHALIQDAAYASLLRRRRQQVHEQVAALLEARFAEVVETQPELVAHHLTEADLHARAAVYWYLAGERASMRSAYAESISHFNRGLEETRMLPDTPERTQQELDIQVALGASLVSSKGQATPEVEQTYLRALELCQQMGDTPHFFPALRGLWNTYLTRGDLKTAAPLGKQLFSMARPQQDPQLLLAAYRALGTIELYQGDFKAALAHFEHGMALHQPHQHCPYTALYGEDTGVIGWRYAAWTLWFLGYPDQARTRNHEAVTMAQNPPHPLSLAFVLIWAGVLHHHLRDVQTTHERVEAAMTLSVEHGIVQQHAAGLVMQGWLLAEQGETAKGIAQIRRGLEARQDIGAGAARPYFLALLAEAYEKAGQIEEGLSTLAEALIFVSASGQRFYEAELYRLQGERLLRLAVPYASEAEACFQRARWTKGGSHKKRDQSRNRA